MFAAEQGHVRVMQELIGSGASINEPDGNLSPLLVAVIAGQTRAVQLLLRSGANVHLTGKTGHDALAHACTEGNRDIASLLLQAGADPIERMRATGRP